MEPVVYKKINGPLSVEWERRCLRKFESHIKEKVQGLTLAGLYLDEDKIEKTSYLN